MGSGKKGGSSLISTCPAKPIHISPGEVAALSNHVSNYCLLNPRKLGVKRKGWDVIMMVEYAAILSG